MARPLASCSVMWPKPMWHGVCVADAFAQGSDCGIRGLVQFSSNHTSWFSLRIHSDEFRSLKIPMHDDLQKDISSLETLAQIAFVYIVIHHLPGCRVPIRIATLSDNTAAESVSNKLFSTQIIGLILGTIICFDFFLHRGG